MTATQAMRRSSTDSHIQQLPRRIPRPATEPPYDDERRTVPPMTDGSLALDLAAPAAAPEIAVQDLVTERHLRVVGGRSKRKSEDPFFAPQPTPRVALPDPHSWSGRFVQALVEVLSGVRPATQLLRWTNERVYADVMRRVRALGVTPAQVRGRSRALVQSVHVCEPCDGVVEAAIHVKHGGRSRAVALRLEGLDGRWRCTALQLG